eukprot:1581490-Prorocentrum_lima.AAC.1
MTSSLVGSEMCIRDSCSTMVASSGERVRSPVFPGRPFSGRRPWTSGPTACLLYTSEAADDM